MPSPRVLHLVISLDYGGLERLVLDWCKARNERHPDSTHICCLDTPGHMASRLDPRWVTCLNARRHKLLFDGRAVRQLRNLLRNGFLPDVIPAPVDIVHTHNMAAHQYGLLAAFRTTCKKLHTQHGSNVGLNSIKNRMRNFVLAILTDRLVAVSKATARDWAQSTGLAPHRIQVIPNGVDLRFMLPVEGAATLRKRFGIPFRATVMGSVGRLSKVKGYDRLIRCFAQMQRMGPPTPGWLLLVGDGPEKENLQSLTASLGLSEKVIFTGYQEKVPAFLNAMDLFVLPSHNEGLSVALLEALSARVPVALTDVGDNCRVIDGGKAGWILPDMVGEWGGRLIEILKSIDSEKSRGKVQFAQSRVSDEYSMMATLKKYEQLYRQLI